MAFQEDRTRLESVQPDGPGKARLDGHIVGLCVTLGPDGSRRRRGRRRSNCSNPGTRCPPRQMHSTS